MIEKIRELKNNELIRGSFIFLILFNLFNMMNFAFHFLSGRLLEPNDYGTLAAIMAIVYIFNVPADSIQTIVSRYTTKVNKNNSKIKALMMQSLKRFFYWGLGSFVLFAIASPFLGKFLNIETPLLIITGALLILVFTLPVNRGILQGMKEFSKLGVNFFAEGIVKLGFVILLILLGMKVYGAVLGIIIGTLFAILISIIFLKKVIKTKTDKNVETKGIGIYSLPVLASVAAITIFYSIDLILAKRFFPDIAGEYAVIAMLGKILFFGSMPISRVMFPLVSERQEKNKHAGDILKKAFLIVFSLCILGLIVYYLFPKLIISILYGAKYLSFANFLIYPSIAMALLAFSNVFIFYNLSSEKKNYNYLLILLVAVQIALLSLFHSTLFQFMLMNIIANAVLFLFMIFIYFKK